MALCATCRRSLLHNLNSSRFIRTRTVSTVPTTKNAAHPTPSINPSNSNPAVSSASPSISQPLSSHEATIEGLAKPLRSVSIKSSVPGGQELRGIAYLKATPHIMAKEDDQYPDWLWSLLDSDKSSGEVKVDLSAMTKKQRHRYDRKQERLQQNIPQQIPVHEQSKDLTGPEDDAITSLERRQEITKSSRTARRKAIREDNFLRSM